MSAAPPAGADAPLDDMTLYELRQILFGDDPNELDVDRWHRQGFVFAGTNAAAPWGLAQVSGGPCGILAPVQAWVINDLLFDRPPALAPVQPSAVAVLPALDVSAGRCQEALVAALVRILISARDAATAPEAYQLVYYRAVQAGAEASGEAEQAPAMQPWLCTIVGSDALHAFVQRVISSFHGPAGVLHFLYSVLLTRGLDRVRQDMDDPRAPLVGQFGHCGQELVNLMITGRAVTNVFDGDKLLGDAADPEAFRLKGVERHFHVGFLTLLEVLRYAKVGMHYKAPLHPIWVIGSDSHYTVAFGDRACIGRLSAAEAATHAAKVAFQQLDPEENGFISADRLADLQRQLAALQNVPIAQLRRELDDGGIVMWERVKTFLLVRLALGFGLTFFTFISEYRFTFGVLFFIASSTFDCIAESTCSLSKRRIGSTARGRVELRRVHVSERTARVRVRNMRICASGSSRANAGTGCQWRRRRPCCRWRRRR